MSVLVATWHDAPPAELPGPAASHFQTDMWVRLLHAYGQEPLCLWIGERDRPPLASWLLYTTPNNYLEPPRHRATKFLDVHLRGMHGPVIAAGLDAAQRDAVVAALTKAVASRARRMRPITTELTLGPVMADDERARWAAAARAAGFDVASRWTYIAHLPDDLEQHASLVKRERRKAARKAEAEGAQFEVGEDMAALREYYAVRDETRRRNGHDPVPWSHFDETWNALSGFPVYRVFLSRFGDRVGAGQVAFEWNGYVYLSGVSVAGWALEERVPANDFLQWSILRWGVENGVKMVDFSGAQPDSEDPKIQAIDYFKSRWGTQLEEALMLSLPLDRTRARAAGLAQRVLG